MIMFVLYKCYLLIFFFFFQGHPRLEALYPCLVLWWNDVKNLSIFHPHTTGSWITIPFPINFVPITQFLLENDKNQEWCAFYDLTVITWTNEPNQVSASSLLEDINFPLQGVVVVTCWDAPPLTVTQDGKSPLRQLHRMLHFQEKSLYMFCPPLPTNIHHSSLPWCCGKRKTQHVLQKVLWRGKKKGKKLSKWSIKHQQMLKAMYYFVLMSLQIIWHWLELPQLNGQCGRDFVFF